MMSDKDIEKFKVRQQLEKAFASEYNLAEFLEEQYQEAKKELLYKNKKKTNFADFGYYCKKKGGGHNSKNNFSHRGIKHRHKHKK